MITTWETGAGLETELHLHFAFVWWSRNTCDATYLDQFVSWLLVFTGLASMFLFDLVWFVWLGPDVVLTSHTFLTVLYFYVKSLWSTQKDTRLSSQYLVNASRSWLSSLIQISCCLSLFIPYGPSGNRAHRIRKLKSSSWVRIIVHWEMETPIKSQHASNAQSLETMVGFAVCKIIVITRNVPSPYKTCDST